MAKQAWKARELCGVVPLDKPGYQLRLFLKTWPDDSQCLEIQKWVEDGQGKATLYWPLQSIQIPVAIAQTVTKLMGAIEIAKEREG